MGEYINPVQIKVESKEVDPCENSRTVHISAIMYHNSGTLISEKSSINANRKSNMGFPMSHQPRSCHSCVTPNFLQMGFRCPHLSFYRRNFD